MQDKSGGSIDIQPKPYAMISDGFTCAPSHYQPCRIPLSSSTEMEEHHHEDGATASTCLVITIQFRSQRNQRSFLVPLCLPTHLGE